MQMFKLQSIRFHHCEVSFKRETFTCITEAYKYLYPQLPFHLFSLCSLLPPWPNFPQGTQLSESYYRVSYPNIVCTGLYKKGLYKKIRADIYWHSISPYKLPWKIWGLVYAGGRIIWCGSVTRSIWTMREVTKHFLFPNKSPGVILIFLISWVSSDGSVDYHS